MNVLVDLLVHDQDICIPLNHERQMPIESLHLVFSSWEPIRFSIGEKITGVTSRVKNLQFVIEDLGIIKGKGPTVQGNAQDILLALTGRTCSIHNLRGDGIQILKGRLSV